jgi:hypothetical protein
VSKFGDATFALMKKRKLASMSSDELWKALPAELTAKSPARKTPRTTCMRDLRKDVRFTVGKGTISLVES